MDQVPAMLAIDFRWWTYLHLVGVFAFLITHGVSVVVAFRLRKERDRDRIRQLLQLSGETILWMYVSLAILLAGGIIATSSLHLWSFRWPKLALFTTILAILLMGAIARPYYQRIKEACTLRPSGAPRVSDEDLAARLTGWQPFAVILIGFGSLIALLAMMVFKWPS